MERETQETFIKKFKRIQSTEGLYGIWVRIKGRIFWLYSLFKLMIRSYKSVLFETVSKGKTRLWRIWVVERVHREPIMIYQMGKVGSMTLEASLKQAYVDLNVNVPIYRGHSLMNFEKYAEFIKTKRGNSSAILKNLEEMKELRKMIEEEPDQLWNLVSMVRDPVARNVAAFFQNIDFHLPEWKDSWESKSLSLQKVQECFFDNEEVDSPFWFETKLEPLFGIDVYATPFPHKTGYKIYLNSPRANLLLIRLENLDQVVTEAIYKFFRIPNFSIKNVNVGEQKPYAALYRAFKQTYLPKFYIERMYSTALARHFYTKEELNAFAYKWTGESLKNG